MKCLIVDDDPMARSVMERLTADSGSMELCGSVGSALEALRIINEKKVDVVFLDVEMPDMNGLEMIRSLDMPPLIVFVTCNPDYAVQAFDLDAADFLLKPITRARFLRSVSKVSRMIRTSGGAAGADRFIYVKKEDAYVRIPVEDIQYLEADSDYVTLHSAKGRFLIHATLTSVSEQLSSPAFRRVHRSFLVNLNQVASFGENMIEISGKIIPVSKSGKKEMMEFLKVL